MGDDLQRQALARDLARRIPLASHDELRIVDAVFARLELGRERYGQLVLAGDHRDWIKERREELLDAIVYELAGELAAHDHAYAELHEAARREMVGDPPTLAELIDRECAAANAAADARERAMDTFGYGGPRPPGTIVGLGEFDAGQTTRIGGPDPYESVEVKLDEIEGKG